MARLTKAQRRKFVEDFELWESLGAPTGTELYRFITEREDRWNISYNDMEEWRDEFQHEDNLARFERELNGSA